MLPIVDKPIIHYVVEEAIESGIEEIIIVVNPSKRALIDYFAPAPELEDILERKGEQSLLRNLQSLYHLRGIRFVLQKEALGLGHAIACARDLIGHDPFAVLLADNIIDSAVPCTRQLIDVYDEYGGCVLGVNRVDPEEIGRFGMVVAEIVRETPGTPTVLHISDLIEKPKPGTVDLSIGIYGRYVLTPDIFSRIPPEPTRKGAEIQLTDAIRASGAAGNAVYGCLFQGCHYDAGTRLGFLEASVTYGLRHPALGQTFRSYLDRALHEPDLHAS